MPSQTDNGKAFEYSVAKEYFAHLSGIGLNVALVQDKPFFKAQSKYNLFSSPDQIRFDQAAAATVTTLLTLEPGIKTQQHPNDKLEIVIAADARGQAGDVRDVVFRRPQSLSNWEIGISAKNNHNAVKHSRLSPTIDFGSEWVGQSCSARYWSDANVVFDYIQGLLSAGSHSTWKSLGSLKEQNVYVPLLSAFRDEMMRLSVRQPRLPQLLLRYLIGRYDFYKVVKDDSNNCVVVRAFNINGQLNQSIAGAAPSHFVDHVSLPSRIIEFDFVSGSTTTLMMILDHGWQISFRLHNASSSLEASLKFDINLIGNPPIIFTQHLFI